MNPRKPDPNLISARASKVVLAVALVTAVSGYFMGLGQLNRAHPSPGRAEVGSAVAGVPPGRDGVVVAEGGEGAGLVGVGLRTAVGYEAMGRTDLKPNAGWQSRFDTLRSPTPPGYASGATSAPAGDAERALAVARRAGRRAYDGAPPVVPHPVDAMSSANCRVCHTEGLVVRDIVAPRMSHAEMGNCTQCHVPAGGGGVPGGPAAWALAIAANSFEGRASVGRGSRAWAGAPPTIPHGTWMRENCSSCHGPTGLAGLRTSHPERTSCVQCHVPDEGFPPGLGGLADLTGTPPGAGLNSPQ